MNFENFFSFYKENNNKILIPDDKKNKYNLNIDNVKKWLEKMKYNDEILYTNDNFTEIIQYKFETEKTTITIDGNQRVHEINFIYKLAKDIIETTEYINFDTLLNQINLISKEIIEKIDLYDQIHFIINDPISKSNLWISLLFMYFFETENIIDKLKQKCHVFASHKESLNQYEEQFKQNEKLRIFAIYFDDMSYSGAQINRNLEHDKTKQQYELYLGVAYIGEKALELIQSQDNVNIFKNTIRVLNLYDKIKKLYGNQVRDDQLKKDYLKFIELIFTKSSFTRKINSLTLHEGITNIYFDHKVADTLSTIQQILLFGSYPISSNNREDEKKKQEECECLPLLYNSNQNCTILDEFDDEFYKLLCKTTIPELNDEMQKKTSPPTFYKSIEYIYNNKIVDKTLNITNIINKDIHKDIFKKKYLKYKNKYLKLKNMN